MTNRQIFDILIQGIDLATKKGAFGLNDVKSLSDALIELEEVLKKQEPKEVEE